MSLLHSNAPSIRLANVTLKQLLGDGAEDYWSGGLFALMITAGYLEASSCFVYSQRGSGVVARHSGKALLVECIVHGSCVCVCVCLSVCLCVCACVCVCCYICVSACAL